MTAKKPELQDFGITPEEYSSYRGKEADGSTFLSRIFMPFKRSRSPKSHIASRIKLYEEAERDYLVDQWVDKRGGVDRVLQDMGIDKVLEERGTAVIQFPREIRRLIELKYETTRIQARQQEDDERQRQQSERQQQQAERARRRRLSEHWKSLSGVEFERELGALYKHLGYRVEFTPTSGDQGIDLILRKNGRTTIVQCKRYKRPAGPAVARELLGSLTASGADHAILACTGGFTRGVEDFVRGKPITLISASDLATMGESVKDDALDVMDQSTPLSHARI